MFKLKEVDLPPQTEITLSKKQVYKNFTTRTHYPGHHAIEIVVNGQSRGKVTFELLISA